MRKRIRITESQLRRTVNEAVRGLLREMDYKTYISAGDKARAQGDKKRADRFYDYAQKMADKEYGYKNSGRRSQKSVKYKPFSSDFAHVSASKDTLDSKNDLWKSNSIGKFIDNTPELNNAYLSNGQWDKRNFSDTYKSAQTRTDLKSGDDYYFAAYDDEPDYKDWRGAYDRASDEARHFANGDYEYRKGQGWRLKNESRRMRGRLLRESEGGTKREIFTLELYDMENEDEIYTPQTNAARYYDVNDAIDAANQLADDYSDDDRVLVVWVFAGEYEDGKGNILGDTTAIYGATNSDKNSYAEVARASGYTSGEADYYAK